MDSEADNRELDKACNGPIPEIVSNLEKIVDLAKPATKVILPPTAIWLALIPALGYGIWFLYEFGTYDCYYLPYGFIGLSFGRMVAVVLGTSLVLAAGAACSFLSFALAELGAQQSKGRGVLFGSIMPLLIIVFGGLFSLIFCESREGFFAALITVSAFSLVLWGFSCNVVFDKSNDARPLFSLSRMLTQGPPYNPTDLLETTRTVLADLKSPKGRALVAIVRYSCILIVILICLILGLGAYSVGRMEADYRTEFFVVEKLEQDTHGTDYAVVLDLQDSRMICRGLVAPRLGRVFVLPYPDGSDFCLTEKELGRFRDWYPQLFKSAAAEAQRKLDELQKRIDAAKDQKPGP